MFDKSALLCKTNPKPALSEPVLSKVEGVEWVKIDKIKLSSLNPF
jgi:hypothetical protein